MASHHFRLHKEQPHNQSEGGYRIKASKSNFPVLQNMSLYKLVLHSKSAREPHWHANADELGYCLKGKVLVSFFGNHNMQETFLIEDGDAFFIPSGAIHSIENLGDSDAELILQFSADEPEDFPLSTAFGIYSDDALGNTWDVPSSHFHPMKRVSRETFAAKLPASTQLSKGCRYISPYQFALEDSLPFFSSEGGIAKASKQSVWPVLRRQALYDLLLSGTGMREPHWHPETAELGYIASGKGKMSLLSPSGKIDVYEMEAGDVYFIPKSYPHYIENLTTSPLHILIFFDQPMPQDIGFSASVKSFPDTVLSSVMHCPKAVFETLPMYYEAQFIVHKKNS